MKPQRGSPTVRFVAAASQVSCAAGDRLAILELGRGAYYTVDPVGARVFELLRNPRSIDDVRDRLVEEFDVAPARCAADLDAFFRELRDAGLIVPADAAAP